MGWVGWWRLWVYSGLFFVCDLVVGGWVVVVVVVAVVVGGGGYSCGFMGSGRDEIENKK